MNYNFLSDNNVRVVGQIIKPLKDLLETVWSYKGDFKLSEKNGNIVVENINKVKTSIFFAINLDSWNIVEFKVDNKLKKKDTDSFKSSLVFAIKECLSKIDTLPILFSSIEFSTSKKDPTNGIILESNIEEGCYDVIVTDSCPNSVIMDNKSDMNVKLVGCDLEGNKSSSDVVTFVVSKDEFYKKIAQCLIKRQLDTALLVNTNYGDAYYEIKNRSGTMNIVEVYNNIKIPDTAEKQVMLTNVDSDKNHYKYYKLTPNSYYVEAEWGSIGSSHNEFAGGSSCRFPSRMYWIKYYEKLEKGYVDKSNVFVNSKKVEVASINGMGDVNAHKELSNLLKSYSASYIDMTTVSGASYVTEGMIAESKRLLDMLYKTTNLNDFNSVLQELMAICPRKFNRMSKKLDDFLAKSKNDLPMIVAREEGLVQAMEGVCYGELNAEVYVATKEQEKIVYSKLEDSLVNKVSKIYRVIPKSNQARFNRYLTNENITKVRQFWHGSRNENWFSIVRNGLSLSPSAKITGKMFGNGIYFAPSSDKSWNYTSYKNSYWAKGTSDTAIMGLYATAYGKPLDVYSACTYSKDTIQGRNCVHAHAGSALRRDEIIFYSEDAMVLNYIVVFK